MTVYIVTSEDFALDFIQMSREYALEYRDFYNTRHPKNTPLIVIECKLDKNGEPDLGNYNII